MNLSSYRSNDLRPVTHSQHFRDPEIDLPIYGTIHFRGRVTRRIFNCPNFFAASFNFLRALSLLRAGRTRVLVNFVWTEARNCGMFRWYCWHAIFIFD
jgi:hypothetical protein